MTTDGGDRPTLPGIELLELRVRTNLNEVWRGVDRRSGEPVAVKLSMTPGGPEALRQEATITHALLGAGVSGVVPAEFRADPMPHLVLPWKGGRTLRDALSELRGPEDRSRAMAVLLRVVDVVAKAHGSGVLHGDLKPENVLLDGDGRPWLTDFGMARAIRSARLESRVQNSMSESAGGWGGTLHYLPPEGLQGELPTTEWDTYALGVMLHEVLLGQRPDRAATPEQLKSRLPADIVDVLLQALAYSPKDRFHTARQLLLRLRDVGPELTATGLLRWTLRGWRFAVVGLAAFFVALRYASVFGLLGLYLFFLIGIFVIHPTMMVAYLPFVLLHAFVRWEGPETQDEAAARRAAALYDRR